MLGLVDKEACERPEKVVVEEEDEDEVRKLVPLIDPNDFERLDALLGIEPGYSVHDFHRFNQKIFESGGFDSGGLELPKMRGFCGLIENVNRLPDGGYAEEYVAIARKCLDFYNDREGCKYEFVELEKMNRKAVSGSIFYVTIKARTDDAAGSSLVTIRAKYWRKISDPDDILYCELFDENAPPCTRSPPDVLSRPLQCPPETTDIGMHQPSGSSTPWFGVS